MSEDCVRRVSRSIIHLCLLSDDPVLTLVADAPIRRSRRFSPSIRLSVLRRWSERRMRCRSGGHQQEGRIRIFTDCLPNEVHRRIGDQVGEIVIGVIVTVFDLHAIFTNTVVVVFRVTDQTHPLVPAWRDMLHSTGLFVGVCVQILAEVCGVIPCFLGVCRVGLLLGSTLPSERAAVALERIVDSSVVVDVVSGEIGGARWTADRCVDEGVGEEDSLVSDETFGFGHGFQSSENDVLVISEDEDDVWLSWRSVDVRYDCQNEDRKHGGKKRCAEMLSLHPV